MKTYWDHSEKERAELSADQVTALLDFELMSAGVLKPVAPKLIEIPTVPIGDKKKVFRIGGKGKYGTQETLEVCFETIEQAQKCLDQSPMVITYDYEIGSEFTYSTPLLTPYITAEEAYDLNQINQFRVSLKNKKAAQENNEKASSKFRADSNKAEKVTQGVWSDWYKCAESKSALKAVADTFQQYLGMTQNNDEMALAFLEKAFSVEIIQEAREWFPDSIYNRPASVAA